MLGVTKQTGPCTWCQFSNSPPTAHAYSSTCMVIRVRIVRVTNNESSSVLKITVFLIPNCSLTTVSSINPWVVPATCSRTTGCINSSVIWRVVTVCFLTCLTRTSLFLPIRWQTASLGFRGHATVCSFSVLTGGCPSGPSYGRPRIITV